MSKDEVFNAEFILKIEPPIKSEIEMMCNNQILISALQVSTQSVDYFTMLNKKNISAFAFEYIQDQQAKLPIVRSMSEIAGNTSLLIASEYLSNINNGIGLFSSRYTHSEIDIDLTDDTKQFLIDELDRNFQ